MRTLCENIRARSHPADFHLTGGARAANIQLSCYHTPNDRFLPQDFVIVTQLECVAGTILSLRKR